MPAFNTRPLRDTPLNSRIKRNPLIFGVPFLLLIVGASYAMVPLMQARYDLDSQRKRSMSREEELGLKKDRKKLDVREEYYRIETAMNQDWEPKRIERPKGTPDWGVPPPERPPPPPPQ